MRRNAFLELGSPRPTPPRIGRGRVAFKRGDERKIPPLGVPLYLVGA